MPCLSVFKRTAMPIMANQTTRYSSNDMYGSNRELNRILSILVCERTGQLSYYSFTPRSLIQNCSVYSRCRSKSSSEQIFLAWHPEIPASCSFLERYPLQASDNRYRARLSTLAHD